MGTIGWPPCHVYPVEPSAKLQVHVVADFSSNTMLGGLAPNTLVGSRACPPAANNLSQAAVVEVVLQLGLYNNYLLCLDSR